MTLSGRPQKFCIFNLTRESFLSLGVTKADTTVTRLRGLLGKRRLEAEEGLWIVPSQGVHTIGMLFPIDAVYLDAQLRVVEVVERLPPFRIGPVRRAAASVIELPTRSIQSSHTQIGDQFLIGSRHHVANYLKQRDTANSPPTDDDRGWARSATGS